MIKVPDHIRETTPYPPGKPIEELEREYGIKNAIKLASNENPLGASPKAIKAMEEALSKVNRYPDGSGFYLRKKISQKFGVPFDGIVLGNGSNEIIEMVYRAFLKDGDEVIVPQPSFLIYGIAARVLGAKPVAINLRDYRIDLKAMAKAVTPKTKVVVVNNPNNPTGTVVFKEEWEEFLRSIPEDIVVILDEAYVEFIRTKHSINGLDYVLSSSPYVISIRTFSKIYGLAGLRIGYAITLPEVADYLNRVRQPFNVNLLAQVAALASLDDDEFLEKTRKLTWESLDHFYSVLGSMGLSYIPTETNFLLIELPVPAKEIYKKLLYRGIITRAMDSYGLERFLRVSVGLPEENQRFLEALKKVLEEES